MPVTSQDVKKLRANDPREPLPPGTSDTKFASMLGERVDLTALDMSNTQDWIPNARYILSPGQRALWFGARGQGKSIVALIFSIQVIDAGGRVVYLDLENGPKRQAARLTDILADRPASTQTALREHFDYRPHVRMGSLSQPGARAAWVACFAGVDVVIGDSISRMLGQLGLDENSAADFTKFMVEYIDPITEQGTAVILLDNTGHDEQQRTRGTSTKLDLTEVAYKVSSDNIGPENSGAIRLERVRTRDGEEATRLECTVGAGSYTALRPAVRDDRDELAEEVLAEVVRVPASSLEDITKALRRRKQSCRSRLLALEEAGTVISRRSQRADRHGRQRDYMAWYPASQSQITMVPDAGNVTDHEAPTGVRGPTVPALMGRTGTVDRGPDLNAEVRRIGSMTDPVAAEREWQRLKAATS